MTYLWNYTMAVLTVIQLHTTDTKRHV